MKIQLMNDIQTIRSFLNDKHILVVEPNNNYRTSIRQFFSNMKIPNVIYTTSSKEALQELHFEKKQWSLIVAEWHLPDLNGVQLCREIRNNETTKDAVFLLLSVENLRSDIMIAGEVKVDGYLLKPFSYEEFVAKLLGMAKSRVQVSAPMRILDEAEKLLASKDYASAEILFKKALEQKPDSARCLHGLGLIHASRGDRERAIELLLLATTKNKQFLDPFRALLDLFESKGDWDSALRVAKILHEESPDNPKYVLKIAQSSLALSDFENAETHFRKVIRLSPRLAAAFKGLGDLYIRTDDYEAAMENYHKALDLESNDVSIINSIALTYVRLGKLEEALKRYQAALRLEPDNPHLLFNLGYAYERQGDFALAANYYQHALALDPNFKKARSFLDKLKANTEKREAKSKDSSDDPPPPPTLRDHDD
jgi:Flp pilus assembly protein TadD